MKSNKIKVISSSFISTLHIDVTEEIDPKYLNESISTNIENDTTVKTSSTTYFLYRYIKECLSYEVLVFDTPYLNNFSIEPFIFRSYYDNTAILSTTDLFITEKYFVVYQNKEFLLLKNISNINSDDAKIYLEQKYQFKIDNTIIISTQELENLSVKYIENTNSNNVSKKDTFFKLYKNNTFYYFIYFIFFCMIIFGYLIYDKNSNNIPDGSKATQETTQEKNYKKLLAIYKKHNSTIIENTLELFKYLKLNKIIITSINYKNSKTNISIINKDKSKLLDFTTMYNKTIDIKSLKFDKESSLYTMEIAIEY